MRSRILARQVPVVGSDDLVLDGSVSEHASKDTRAQADSEIDGTNRGIDGEVLAEVELVERVCRRVLLCSSAVSLPTPKRFHTDLCTTGVEGKK